MKGLMTDSTSVPSGQRLKDEIVGFGRAFLFKTRSREGSKSEVDPRRD